MTQSKAVEAGGAGLQGSERERVLRKIKRCLALSQSSNQNEADMAMRQAQAMMREYRLSEADVHASEVNKESRDTGLKRLPEWQRDLGFVAAKAFGCKFFTQPSFGGLVNVRFLFIGVMPAAELAAYAYDTLLVQAHAARKAFKSKRAKTSRKVADDFCIAWVYAVSQKVEQFARDNPVSGTKANALVVVQSKEEAAIDAWVAAEFDKVTERKGRHRDDYDRGALLHGRAAGEKATINQAMTGNDKAALMLTAE